MSDSGSPGAVLVVYDDPAIRRSLERGLRLSGFRVRTAEGGREALDAIEETPPTSSSTMERCLGRAASRCAPGCATTARTCPC